MLLSSNLCFNKGRFSFKYASAICELGRKSAEIFPSLDIFIMIEMLLSKSILTGLFSFIDFASKSANVFDTAEDERKSEGLNEDRTAFRMEPRSVILLSCPGDEPVKKRRKKSDDSTAGGKYKRVSKTASGKK